jgi:O-antigen/teichoic acid export membrane protein
MSRLALTLKNAWIALIFQIVYVVVQFYSRNIFLDSLGDDFIGTVGTLKSIMLFLNLSELGIGAAVGFSLYKPIFDNNREKINEIIGYLGFLYKRIGLFVIIAAVILMFFFPFMFQNTNINIALIIFLFVALLTSNLVSYFFTYHMFLLEADQKGYVNVTINQTVFITRLILQCLVLIYFKSVMFWILLELLTPFIYIYILRKKIRKIYPWLIFKFKTTKEIRQNNQPLLKKIKQLSFHKIGGFVSNGTDNILIFAFINPATVAFVGNYQLVMSSINVLVSKLFQGTNASVGNLVAENDIKNMSKVFWEMMALRFFFASCASLMLYIGFDDLIRLWLGEKYLLSHNILISLVIIFFILQVRQPVDSFKQAYGLYADIWSPLVQSILNLVISIIFVVKFGVIGVFVGTIISQIIIVMLWRPFYLFTSGFKIGSSIYWKGFSFHLLYLFIACACFFFISDFLDLKNSSNLLFLIIKVLKSGLIFSTIYFLILILFSEGFKNLISRFYFFIKNKK